MLGEIKKIKQNLESKGLYKSFWVLFISYVCVQCVQFYMAEFAGVYVMFPVGVVLNFVMYPLLLMCLIQLADEKAVVWKEIKEGFKNRIGFYLGTYIGGSVIVVMFAVVLLSLLKISAQGDVITQNILMIITMLATYFGIKSLLPYLLVLPISLDQELSIVESLEESKDLMSQMLPPRQVQFLIALLWPSLVQISWVLWNSSQADTASPQFLFLINSIFFVVISIGHAVSVTLLAFVYNEMFQRAEALHQQEDKKLEFLK